MNEMIARLVEHFRRRLAEEPDEARRRIIRRLLAEEEARLTALTNPVIREKRAR
jgi:hypothetical protein